jgi:DNA-binding CsgD family transcriptional regulator
MSPYFEPLGAESSTPLLHAQLSLALFDQIGCGLIVCDGDGMVRFANQAARRELGSGGPLSSSGRQVQRAAGASGELAVALRSAALKGRRSLVRLVRGDERLFVSTLPFMLPGLEQSLVLVMLGRRQACSALDLEMLGSSYGLTLAERRVLAGLVREAKPKEIADQNAVKVSTVRTQISSIRSKLGTRSVEGLLLRAAEMPPMAAAA